MIKPIATPVQNSAWSRLLASSLLVLSACMTPLPFSQDGLPAAVTVPGGNTVAMEVAAVGKITYQCRASNKSFEWVFVGPQATLKGRDGKPAGRYFGPPATWESADGSLVTGVQLAVAPAGAGNIPLQLVKANPATGKGGMQGVSYIQRVATRGGVAPDTRCDLASAGKTINVGYQADYIFYRAN